MADLEDRKVDLEVALGIVEHEGTLLFIRRANEPFRGLVGLLSGKIETKRGELPETAFKREVFEKSALGISHGTPLGIYYETII